MSQLYGNKLTLLTKVSWRTAGAPTMLETKVGFSEAMRSSVAEIVEMDAEGTPAIRVPRDSREAALLSCQLQFYQLSFFI